MKKLVLVFMILLVTVSILVGCAAKTTTTSAPPKTTTTSAATSSAPTTTTSKPATTATTTTTAASDAAKYGGTLRIIIIAGPQNAGGWPAEVFGPDATSYQFCMEPLLHGDNKGNMVPWLAESYKVSDDLKSITFTLRKGIKFHDGTDFNAKAAKWNLDNQIKAKASAAQYWASVDQIDDYTIRLNLTMWTNTIVSALDGVGTWMVSPAAYDKNGLDWMRSNPVGTGPYKFVSFQRDVGYKVVKNPDYWIKGRPYLDAIDIKYVADQLTQQAAMKAGEADILQLEPSRMAKDLSAVGFNVNFQIITTYTFLPDSAHPDSPYANQKVREAVEYSIDRESMAKAFSYGYWSAPYQQPPPSNAAYNPDFSLARKYDPVKAKQLLTDAGFPSGFSTTILVNPAIIDRNISVALQNNLSALGINAKLSFPANMGGFIGDSNSLNNVLVIQPVMSSVNYNSTFMFFNGKDFMWNKNFAPPASYVALRDKSITAREMDVTLIRAVTDQLSKEASAIPFMLAGMGWAMNPKVMEGGFFKRGSSDVFNSEEVWLSKK